MPSTLSAVNRCLFLLMISPAFEKACSNVALDACAHNRRVAQSTTSGGALSCLLHQASTVVGLWSPYFFTTSFCPNSQLQRIISRLAFTELREYSLIKNFSMAGVFIAACTAMPKQGYAQQLESKGCLFLIPLKRRSHNHSSKAVRTLHQGRDVTDWGHYSAIKNSHFGEATRTQ